MLFWFGGGLVIGGLLSLVVCVEGVVCVALWYFCYFAIGCLSSGDFVSLYFMLVMICLLS